MKGKSGKPKKSGKSDPRLIAKYEPYIKELKNQLIHGDRFSDIMNYFFDHMADHPEFILLGDRGYRPLLDAVLERIGESMFKRKMTLTEPVLSQIPEYKFVHGACTLEGRMVCLFYFDDLEMGLLAVSKSVFSKEVLYSRFSAVEVNSDKPIPGKSPPPDLIH